MCFLLWSDMNNAIVKICTQNLRLGALYQIVVHKPVRQDAKKGLHLFLPNSPILSLSLVVKP